MSLPMWPAGLPHGPLRGSFKVTQATQPSLRSEMNAGTTRNRRKTTLRISRASVVFVFTNEQLDAFRAFHEIELGEGAARFNMPIVFGGREIVRTVLIVDPPAYDPMTRGRTRVALSLAVEAL